MVRKRKLPRGLKALDNIEGLPPLTDTQIKNITQSRALNREFKRRVKRKLRRK